MSVEEALANIIDRPYVDNNLYWYILEKIYGNTGDQQNLYPHLQAAAVSFYTASKLQEAVSDVKKV